MIGFMAEWPCGDLVQQGKTRPAASGSRHPLA
jgi:hypothetical protein